MVLFLDGPWSVLRFDLIQSKEGVTRLCQSFFYIYIPVSPPSLSLSCSISLFLSDFSLLVVPSHFSFHLLASVHPHDHHHGRPFRFP